MANVKAKLAESLPKVNADDVTRAGPESETSTKPKQKTCEARRHHQPMTRPQSTSIRDLPEVAGLGAPRSMVRIPPELDVPMPDRVLRLIDSAPFRRLTRVRQLGLVALVYPGATHSRFEHSIGVYRMALLFLRHFANEERFTESVSAADAELFIVTALLHDVGHWPYCHPIEDLALDAVPRHEKSAERFIAATEIARLLDDDWGITPKAVLDLLAGRAETAGQRILGSMLNGPIDIDKLDYLMRDSLHAGVPYGRNYDRDRLIGSLCLNENGDGIALTEKGKTAAELLVFARYVMFSEVYWHHSVRSATAMLQRAFFDAHERLDLGALFASTDGTIEHALTAATSENAKPLVDGLFGPVRTLYKRLGEYSYFQSREVYDALARRPYPWLARCAEEFARRVSNVSTLNVTGAEILFDAPPIEKEVEFKIDVHFPKENIYRQLGEVSPVVRALAREQFDDYVKRVRVFAHPRVANELRGRSDLEGIILDAAQATE